MPNIINDGFIDPAQFILQVSLLPGNSEYALCNAVSAAIGNAAVGGLRTVSVATAAYATALVQLLIERLINCGYATATLSGTTLTVTW